MPMAKGIPEGYTGVMPYLTVDDGEKAVEFYRRAFGATERTRMAGPDGKIAHCELEIGDAVIMLSDEFPQFATKSPKQLGGTTVGLFMYVEDVDEAIQTAADAGATITMPAEDQFWGDRFGQVQDPFGHQWQLASRVEELTPEEIERRARDVMAAMSQG
jgi:PhnB protein